jgi:hypothetical protein
MLSPMRRRLGHSDFLTVYLLTCMLAPVELFRARTYFWVKLAMGLIGVSLMALVLGGFS